MMVALHSPIVGPAAHNNGPLETVPETGESPTNDPLLPVLFLHQLSRI